MPQTFWPGMLLIVFAGVMAGDCMLPLKWARKWQWENTWLVFSLVSLVLLPWMLAVTVVHDLFRAYAQLSLVQLGIPVLFGAGWGLAQAIFGISIRRLGMALAYAIVIGLGTLLGILVPLFAQHGAQLGRSLLVEVFAGIAITLVGIAFSA